MNLLFLFFFLTFGCKQQEEQSIYLIPKGYSGAVVIIFDQAKGKPPVYKNDKRCYEIPLTGILKTQFKPNFGISNNEFRCENILLKYMTSQDWTKFLPDSNKIVCWNLQTGVSQDSNNKKINFEVFFVGPIKLSEEISDGQEMLLSKALKSL